MPYVSDAQRRYFNANRAKLEAQGVNVDEWNHASKGMKLPARKADGGEIEDETVPFPSDDPFERAARITRRQQQPRPEGNLTKYADATGTALWQRFGHPAVNAAQTFGRAASGENVPLDEAAEGMWDAANTLAGVPLKPKGLGMIGGRMARGVNLGNMFRAEDMIKGGMLPKPVWHETGWGFAPGSRKSPFWELNDQNSRFDPNLEAITNIRNLKDAKLGDWFHHPEFYAAYPEAKDIGFNAINEPLTWGYGVFSPHKNSLTINSRLFHKAANPTVTESPESTALHELQHWVQAKEGWPTGASAEGIMWRTFNDLKDRIKNTPPDSAANKHARELLKNFLYVGGDFVALPHTKSAAFKVYRREAGETQARNTQTRMHMGPEARRKIPPWETQDIPYDQQLVRWGEEMADGGAINRANRIAQGYAKGGLINSAVPGRTDKHPMKVKGGSYVFPADVVSGLGENNTMAGSKMLDGIFNPNQMPFDGGKQPKLASPRSTSQRIPGVHSTARTIRQRFADGGETEHEPVDIIAAGGEYIVEPEHVARIGGGDLERGFKILDAFVKYTRQKNIKKLSSLPGPKK